MSETAERLPNKKHVAALWRQARKNKDEVASINGDLNQKIAAAVENGHLNKKAFSIVRSLIAMKDENLRDDCLRVLPVYIDFAREEGLLPNEHVGDLVESAQRHAVDGDDESDADGEPLPIGDIAADIAAKVAEPFDGDDEAKRRAALTAAEQAEFDAAEATAKKRGRRVVSTEPEPPKPPTVGQAAGTYSVTALN